MEHVRSHGYPAPAVEEVSADGTELVMERLDGPSMFAAMSRRPWIVRQQGGVLADLHRRLHEIPPPPWVPDAPFGGGDSLLHLDLHPLNVMLTSRGPVVIDWPNARRGDGDADIAVTWVLTASATLPTSRLKAAVLGQGRALLVRGLLGPFDRDAVRAHFPAVVEWKVADANMSDAERAAMRALLP